MFPLSFFIIPNSNLINVVFPAPFAPTRPITEPLGTSKLKLSKVK